MMGLLFSYLILGIIIWPFSYWYFFKKRGSSKGMAFFQGIGAALVIFQIVQKSSSALPASSPARISPTLQATAYRSPTSTPRDYSVIQTMMIKPGDLPLEYTAGMVLPSLTSNLLYGTTLPQIEYGVSQEIKRSGTACCIVTILCSNVYKDIGFVFDQAIDAMKNPTLFNNPPAWAPGTSLGSRAAYDDTDLIFRGARYLVLIEGIPYNIAYSYGIDLMERLNDLAVCGSY
jgi:hypothetical protein